MVSHVSITPRDALVCYQHIWMLTVSSIPCWHMLFNKWLKKPTNEWTNDCLWNMLKFIFISRQTTANLTVFYSHKAPPIQPADNESVSHSCKAMIMTWAHMRNHPFGLLHPQHLEVMVAMARILILILILVVVEALPIS